MTRPATESAPRFVLGLIGLILFGTLLGTPACSADEPAKDKQSAPSAADKEEGEKNEYLLSDATAAELLDGIRKLQEQEDSPKGLTRQEKIKDFVKIQEAVIDAANRILADQAAEEKTAADAFTALTTALTYETRLKQDNATQRLAAAIEKYRNDSRAMVATEARFADAKQRITQLAQLNASQRQEVVNDVMAYLKQQEPSKENLTVAMSVADSIENADPKLAAKAYAEFATFFATSSDEKVKEYASKLAGSARRLDLPGNFMEIDGTKVDGEKFDWSAYRGKIVLVDFWATWCGPCVAELPNVKKNYELYHDRGFDVVGISLDDDRTALEKFLKTENIAWATLYSDDPKAQGWNTPLASHYGIMGIPSVFLLDKDGKVISMNARGERLGAQLAELLGPPGEAPAEKDNKAGVK